MGILYDMYHGKSGFFGEERITNPDYIKCVGKLAALEEDILKQYPDIESQLEQLHDLQGTTESIAEYEMFAAGFRTGAQLMMEMLRGE